jgi:hypothetical protein
VTGVEPNKDLVTLTVKPNEFEAAAVVAVLDDAGIQAWAFGAGQAALPLGDRVIGVPVQVRQDDVERAQAALQQKMADSVDLDWDMVDVGDRVDDVSLTSRRRMPLVVRLGYWLAVTLILIMLLAAAVIGLGVV